MKQIMYALYTTKNSKMPRHIYARAKDAKSELFALRKVGITWGIIERVEVTKKNETAYDICHHEYRKEKHEK